MSRFVTGRLYQRKSEIHDVYGGQRFGGISTPRNHPLIFLFTGEAGGAFGYSDHFSPDGTFHYCGEGQVGDMRMAGGNRAVRDHLGLKKELHLFEKVRDGNYRYSGGATCLGYYESTLPDREGRRRTALIFELDVVVVDGVRREMVAESVHLQSYSALTLHDLRLRALVAPPQLATVKERRELLRSRSMAVRLYVLRRAKGRCEGCLKKAPFVTRKGQPYLEAHHTRRLADGGPDHPRWVAALCPNCHCEVHQGKRGEELNRQIVVRLGELEPDE